MSANRLVIVGVPEETHVGAHLLRAAQQLGLDVSLCDSRQAYSGPSWRRRTAWWLGGRRPLRLRAFSRTVLDAISAQPGTVLLTTGIAPIDRQTLAAARKRGVRTANFLTDDPWNPSHRAPWFLEALTLYDIVFTPRRANAGALVGLGGPAVEYVPFAYAPEIHFPEPPANEQEAALYDCDILFAGGADAERVEVLRPLIEAGFTLALYGGYWSRYEVTRNHARGFLDAPQLRRALSGARICLCLVRRSNRDGHSMRSFEVPACGGCMLLEDTPEHREIFGADDDAVVYFSDASTLVDRTRALLADPRRRARLSKRAHALISNSPQTYRDRLARMLSLISNDALEDRHRRPRAIPRV